MSVKIVVAKEGYNTFAANGVKVFTQDGREIEDIMAIDVRFRPGEIVTATMEIALHPDTKLEDLLPLFDCKTLEELAESRGFMLVPNNEE